MVKKLIKRLLNRCGYELCRKIPSDANSSGKHIVYGSKTYFVLSYSNLHDCIRWNLSKDVTPWDWASNWVLEMTKPISGDRILDLGCIENPYILKYCSNNNIKATLVDIAPKPDNLRLPEHITFVQADLTSSLPFADESFNVILSESSLEHLPADARLYAFEEALRCLQPGGRLAVSIGLPVDFGNDCETINAFESHEYFANRYCSVYFPIDVKQIIERIDPFVIVECRYPYNYSIFPGFEKYSEDTILRDPNILFDKYADYADVPDVANLRGVSVVEIGLFYIKPHHRIRKT